MAIERWMARTSAAATLALAAAAMPPPSLAAAPVCDWATGMLCVAAPASVTVGKSATFRVSLTNTTASPISGQVEGGSFLVVKGNTWDWQYDFLDFSALQSGATMSGTMKWKITWPCSPCSFPFRALIDGSTTIAAIAVTVPLG
jgi:hypothetical protein